MTQPSLFGDDAAEGGDLVALGGGGRAATPASTRRLVVEADGGSRGNPGPAGYGALVREGERVLAERGGFLGVCSNNVAEYTGLIEGLRAAAAIDPGAQVEVRMDSTLVVEQMSGRWKIKHGDMRRLADDARAAFDPRRVTYMWVPRALNGDADALANAAMDSRGEIRHDYVRVAGEPAAAASTDPASTDPASTDPAAVADPGAAGDVAPPAEVPAPTAPEAAPRPKGSGIPIRRADGEPVTVVLVRHGVTTMTEAARYSGGDRPGPPLSEAGRAQVARAAGLLAGLGDTLWTDLPRPTAVIASPMVRTQDTAAILVGRLRLPAPVLDDAFAECRFGDWEGLTVEEMEERWPGELARWATEDGVRPSGGGESMIELGERVGARLRALAHERAGETVVVAAHAVVIRAAVGIVATMPPSAWNSVRVPPASVTVLRLWPGGVGELTVVACPAELGA
ncbi:bifunctional RNase H/acid phosphatase [Georgenia faecalis]|uniref:bifunctional RNase H/acid phosphatase n=1 Tax=Georgenia faecalis TaxID=2483799 RepID=UPI001F4936C1|nr:bifunctional RNase H/acid phosphatase [Georgenia faecalis]